MKTILLVAIGVMMLAAGITALRSRDDDVLLGAIYSFLGGMTLVGVTIYLLTPGA